MVSDRITTLCRGYSSRTLNATAKIFVPHPFADSQTETAFVTDLCSHGLFQTVLGDRPQHMLAVLSHSQVFFGDSSVNVFRWQISF